MRYEVMVRAHLPQAAAMYAEAFNAPPWNDRWTVETAYGRLSQMMNREGFHGLVCFRDGALCGLILGELDLFYDFTQVYIKEFCVNPSFRGMGIGTALLNEFERRLFESGITKAYLFTSRTSDTEGFYHKQGYDSWNNMVMMGKFLG